LRLWPNAFTGGICGGEADGPHRQVPPVKNRATQSLSRFRSISLLLQPETLVRFAFNLNQQSIRQAPATFDLDKVESKSFYSSENLQQPVRLLVVCAINNLTGCCTSRFHHFRASHKRHEKLLRKCPRGNSLLPACLRPNAT